MWIGFDLQDHHQYSISIHVVHTVSRPLEMNNFKVRKECKQIINNINFCNDKNSALEAFINMVLINASSLRYFTSMTMFESSLVIVTAPLNIYKTLGSRETVIL